MICYLFLDFHVQTVARFLLRDKRLFEISEVEITWVDCSFLLCEPRISRKKPLQCDLNVFKELSRIAAGDIHFSSSKPKAYRWACSIGRHLSSVHPAVNIFKRHLLWSHEADYITKTRLYNFDPLKPHFYIIKLGFTGVYIIFLISAQKHRLWVLVRTASPRLF